MSDIVAKYVAAADARIAFEVNADKNAKRFLNEAKAFVSNAAFAQYLHDSEVTAFFNDQENAAKKVCMKMINRAIEYARHAVSSSHHFSRKTRDFCVLETMLKLHIAKQNMTLDDARASCTTAADKKHQASKEHAKHIVHCSNIIDAVERQCSMSLLALLNMRIIEKVSANEYKLADTKIAKDILAKFKKNNK